MRGCAAESLRGRARGSGTTAVRRLGGRLLVACLLSGAGCQGPPPAPSEAAEAAAVEVPRAPTPSSTVELPAPPPRPAISEAERAAIAEARGRAAVPPVIAPATGTTVAIEAGKPTEPGRLTAAERRAARDDPAVRLDLPAAPEPPAVPEAAPSDAPPAADPPPPAPAEPSTGDEVRPGVTLFTGTGQLRLVDLAIATSVQKRVPQGVSDRFVEMPAKFMCFSVFENRADEATVTHVWRRDGRVVSRVELQVGHSPKWRTWSRQRVKPTWTGKWTCEVQAPGGKVLGRAEFAAGS